MRSCGTCHEARRAASARLTRAGWAAVIDSMIGRGAQIAADEVPVVLDYLSTHFLGEASQPLNVNTAPQIDFESAGGLLRREAAAVVRYRERHGRFKTIETLRVDALEEQFDGALALGEHRELTPALRSALADDPFRERLWGQLMLALYRSGRQADALETFQEARRVLADELGLEPGPELRRLQEAILAHDPAIATVPVDRRRRNLPAPSTSFVGREDERLQGPVEEVEHPVGEGDQRVADGEIDGLGDPAAVLRDAEGEAERGEAVEGPVGAEQDGEPVARVHEVDPAGRGVEPCEHVEDGGLAAARVAVMQTNSPRCRVKETSANTGLVGT